MVNIYKLLGTYFSIVHDEYDDSKALESYENVVKEKESYRKDWSSFLSCIKGSKFPRVVNLEPSSERHCFKASLSFPNNNQGIILCISMIGKLVGIYYDQYYRGNNYLPMYNYRGNSENYTLSYYPATAEQEEFSRYTIETATSIFTSFQKFDNFYASKLVENIIVDRTRHEKLDLFQAFFCTNVHGTI